MNKAMIVQHLRDLLQRKVDATVSEINNTRASRDADTKSSAGDKHEVGRAMIQQELDKQEAQLARFEQLQQELAQVDLDRVSERIGIGGLVRTDQGAYFIAIGIGPLDTGDGVCYAVSSASPIGQALMHKRVGEEIVFNGRKIRILSVE